MNPHTAVMGGIPRRLCYGGTEPIVDDDGVCHVATVQHCGTTYTANDIQASHVNGFPGRMDRDGLEWRIAYLKGDPLTAGKCRSQLNMPPLGPGDYTHAMSFRLGSDAEPWELRPAGQSPVLLWQFKSQDTANSPKPVLSLNADVDEADPDSLVLFIGHKPNNLTANPTRWQVANKIKRHTIVHVELAGRWAADDGGYVRVSVDGDQRALIVGKTMSDSGLHQVGAGAYLYNDAIPANAPTRVTRWQRLVVY